MLIRYVSKESIQTLHLTPAFFLLRMADDPGLLVPKHEPGAALVFNDTNLDYGIVRKPTREDAVAILEAYQRAKGEGCSTFIAQCEAGVGRSPAVVAALLTLEGDTSGAKEILRMGTYNRLLYRLILEAAGKEVSPDPLVSMVVRMKYPLDRLDSFLACMERQRWNNIEIIAVTDGITDLNIPFIENLHRGGGREVYKTFLKVIKTPTAKGRWGHPYRQLGIDAAQGEWVGVTNDDNYYVPGFIEQMVGSAEDANADLVICDMLHSYSGWERVAAGGDLGCFLARRELIRQVPWEGDDLKADRRFLQGLVDRCRNVAIVNRALFIHN